MPEDFGAANGFTGQSAAPVNAGVQPESQIPQGSQVPQQTQQPQGGYQGTPEAQTPQPQQGQQEDQFGHRIRSALTSAEQQWQQKNSTALQLEQTLRSMGRDPGQVLQQIQEAQRQAQMEAQQQQAQGMGVSPQLLEQMQQMQQQVQSVTQVIGQQRLAEAERTLTDFAGKFGVDYNQPEVQSEIRQFALNNNVNLDTAFKSLYFDRITQVTAQQAAGQQIAALQGRAAQPLSSAATGSTQQAPVNYLSMNDAQFAEAERRLKGEWFAR